ncbi:uncharacterized protein HGUI_02411 [Hanseniaspora guilliermondii]|uniref:tRNA pseudouridine(55) synthase n=1 Tax=Hanseniaspora guilliermondii TaxID=56406 RepID=A0A1L0B588_9ASCO|nr:uncharacterized protein HGUI_02411 [Hanseniaspora guilliermondii]
MNGVFAIEKPSGFTTQQIITKLNHALINNSAQVRKDLLRQKEEFEKEFKANNKGNPPKPKTLKKFSKLKMGQGGTLDPMASGILVIGIQEGTKKLQKYLNNSIKTYEFRGILGMDTMSGDNQENYLSNLSINSYEHLLNLSVEEKKALEEKIIASFKTGILKQIPPVYSAVRIGGKRLYEYIRKGEDVPQDGIEPRLVELMDIHFYEDNLQEIEQDELSEDEYNKIRDDIEDTMKNEAQIGSKRKFDEVEKQKSIDVRLGKNGEILLTDEAFNVVRDYKNQIKCFTHEHEDGIIHKDEDLNKITDINNEFYQKMKKKQVPLIQLHMKVTVSSGFYIRSIIRDICKLLKTSGYMTSLKRVSQKQWDMEKGAYFKLQDFEKIDETVWFDLLTSVLKDEDEGSEINVRKILDKNTI